jgi:hypothetical protein
LPCAVIQDPIPIIQFPSPPASPTPTVVDNASFLTDITIPDDAVLSANQSFAKTWRLRNTGDSTWGAGYQLAFTTGNQLGAPGSVPLPRSVAPGETVDIRVNMVAPTAGGTYQGDWRLRNAQGISFGDRIWVRISVPFGSAPPPPTPGGAENIALQGVDFPPVVRPNQSFRPRVTVRINQGQLLQSRGDMLRNTDGKLYGAWPQVAVAGTVNSGQNYTFEFYQNNPITAPSGEGTYESKWRVWRDGNWAGPEIAIRFDVRNGGGTRPNPPGLVSPNNWAVSRNGSTPPLCASAPSGLKYYFQIYESHDTPESGWQNSSCWTPPTLGAFTYKWHVKARDSASGLESDWSNPWNFSIDSQQLTMDDIVFTPSSPSATDDVRVYTCVRGFGSIGLSLKIEANTATDGSASGEWQWIHHLGTFCYDRNNSNSWPTWGTRPLADGTHLIRATGFGPQGQTVVKEAQYTLNRRRPSDTQHLTPETNGWANSRTVTFSWQPALRATGYQLLVATDPPTPQNAMLNVTLNSTTTNYSFTFDRSYPQLYAQVVASNELGSAGGWWTFGIDTSPPTASVTALPATTTETQFAVSWGGADTPSGVRWYNVQYRDGGRPDSPWIDWKTSTAETAAIFTGEAGHTYSFRAQALDNAGNLGSYAGGDGDTTTTVDLAARPQTPWWNASYAHKRNVIVLNNDADGLSAGYPVRLHFDATTSPTAGDLYNASQSPMKGADFRIVYNNQTELPRFVQTFANDRIDIWFDLRADIGSTPGSDNASYQLYYGNAAAATPSSGPDIVFQPSADANTIGLWRFGEGAGATVSDSSGRGYNGTASNMSWGAGKFGPAGGFNGTNAVVNLGNSSEFNLSSFSAEAWIYFTDLGTERSVFIKHASDGSLIYDADTVDGEPFLRLNGNSCYVRSNRKLVPGRWYHLAWTYDGATARTFVNGELTNSSNCGQSLRTGDSTLWLGGDGKFNNKYINGYIQHARLSNIARPSFAYGGYASIDAEPSVAAGDSIQPPIPTAPDLAVLDVTTYPNEDGSVLVQVIGRNQGDGPTQNGFDIDLYTDHQPTGAGDYAGSVHFWEASPIDAGGVITLTTLLTDTGSPLLASTTSQVAPLSEITRTLFVQADSGGVIDEPNKADNISSRTEVCFAAADSYEGDDTASQAKSIAIGQAQTHNIDSLGDQDWVKFVAQAGEAYVIRTADLDSTADTYLSLYDTDGTSLLAANDDDGTSLSSQIEWVAPGTGTYYVQVKHWNPNMSGCGTSYDLVIATGNRAPAVSPIADHIMRAGTSDNITVSAVDPDGTTPDLSASNLPSFAAFTDNGDGTGTLVLNPGIDAAGTYSNITVTASDGELSGSSSFNLEIKAAVQPLNCDMAEDFSYNAADWTLWKNATTVNSGGNIFLRLRPPANNDAEAWANINRPDLAGYTYITLRINTHGAILLGGDASAQYLDQDGWKYVSLSDYVVQGQNSWQTVTMPIGDYPGFDKSQEFSRFGFRFWMSRASTIDVDDIQLCTGGAPLPPPMTCNTIEDFSSGAWTLWRNAAMITQGGDRLLRLTPPAGDDAEAWADVNNPDLVAYTYVRMSINTHAASLLGGDASAQYLDQDGWKYVSLSDYVIQGLNGWQRVTIPISDYPGFDKSQEFSRFGFRFWMFSTSTIDIDDIQFCN